MAGTGRDVGAVKADHVGLQALHDTPQGPATFFGVTVAPSDLRRTLIERRRIARSEDEERPAGPRSLRPGMTDG